MRESSSAACVSLPQWRVCSLPELAPSPGNWRRWSTVRPRAPEKEVTPSRARSSESLPAV
jgi:hypothetical protein